MRVRCTPVSVETPSVSPFVMLACCPTKKADSDSACECCQPFSL